MQGDEAELSQLSSCNFFRSKNLSSQGMIDVDDLSSEYQEESGRSKVIQ